MSSPGVSSAGAFSPRAKREKDRARMAEIGDSSAEAWTEVRKGAQAAYDELHKAFREASKKF